MSYPAFAGWSKQLKKGSKTIKPVNETGLKNPSNQGKCWWNFQRQLLKRIVL
jgi:hypothetical protein